MVNILYNNTLAVFSPLYFVSASNQGLDEKINDAFMPFAVWWENLILAEIPLFGQGIPLILIILMGGALFFTIYFGFVNVRHFTTAIQAVSYTHLTLPTILRV